MGRTRYSLRKAPFLAEKRRLDVEGDKTVDGPKARSRRLRAAWVSPTPNPAVRSRPCAPCLTRGLRRAATRIVSDREGVCEECHAARRKLCAGTKSI